MFDLSNLGRFLIITGILLAAAGLLLMLGGKIPWLGRLPGDILIRKERFTFYFPLVTCLLISLLLTILFSVFRK